MCTDAVQVAPGTLAGSSWINPRQRSTFEFSFRSRKTNSDAECRADWCRISSSTLINERDLNVRPEAVTTSAQNRHRPHSHPRPVMIGTMRLGYFCQGKSL